MNSNYEEFSIQIKPNGKGFQLYIRASPRSEGFSADCVLPLEIAQIPEALEALERSLRRPSPTSGGSLVGRDLFQENAPDDHEEFSLVDLGDRLYDGLFRGHIRETLTTCLGRVEERPEIGLRIRLMIDPQDERLAPWFAMPWELLCRSGKNDFFGVDVRTPVVRSFPVDRPTSALPPVDAIRILVVAPKPDDMVELLSEKEIRNLSAEWKKENNIEIKHLERGTLDGLRDAVVRESFHVIHFIGHGDFDERSGEGVLFFESESGGLRAVSGKILASALVTQGRVRIAVLNACESAQFTRKGGQNPFSGVASALLLSGVPAVVAHQFKISDQGAIVFSKAFYRALAAGHPVDNAITQARHVLYLRETGDGEWLIPVLYLSTADGDVLSLRRAQKQVEAVPLPEVSFPPPPPKRDLTAAARRKVELAQYRSAIETLEQAMLDGEMGPRIFFYLALAQIGGRRPRALSFGAMDHVEKDLEKARAMPEMGAEVLYLMALTKEDHYSWNGRVPGLPTVEQCLKQADLRTVDAKELQLILDVVPETPGLVRPRVLERLARSSA